MSGATRALVVHCHPLTEGLIPGARDRVLAGLGASEAESRLNDLYADGFVPELSRAEKEAHLRPGAAPDVERYVEDLLWCSTLVLVYPTWWSGQPAMLKGWMDRVWASGVAWDLPEGANKLRPALLNVRRLVAVTTHGSSKWINAFQGEGGKRTMTRSLRAMCHPMARTTWLALYGVDTCTAEKRSAFLDRVEAQISALS
jgi:putative NADPH-quinone reductase